MRFAVVATALPVAWGAVDLSKFNVPDLKFDKFKLDGDLFNFKSGGEGKGDGKKDELNCLEDWGVDSCAPGSTLFSNAAHLICDKTTVGEGKDKEFVCTQDLCCQATCASVLNPASTNFNAPFCPTATDQNLEAPSILCPEGVCTPELCCIPTCNVRFNLASGAPQVPCAFSIPNPSSGSITCPGGLDGAGCSDDLCCLATCATILNSDPSNTNFAGAGFCSPNVQVQNPASVLCPDNNVGFDEAVTECTNAGSDGLCYRGWGGAPTEGNSSDALSSYLAGRPFRR
uniref:Disintegrin domain-containing protein n=1 Tax=Chromera velia CCMP2878 TaxID=1169474 RepID=A0A0G4I2E4_9ALVE|eukprot:Cvel_10314.t1-p1 / transcript=Cvel_10314.t1 / gene=Cvel_10314 / organism=Chromera_velia_CCMP2878 / gene_product=hypothetical protein / transcript_product=hypothetical protein / location=Cvel_scaffold619:31089-38133(+) / protein_length=285 / sequence_SO=supercontig / SO=protein_coding / is_pseudo=false